jgi:4-hydroxybenzoate polyprenyltransferase
VKSFLRKIRISDPWNYKIPFLIAIPYLYTYHCNIDAKDSILRFFWAYITIIGIAGFAYTLNDFTDRKKDEKAKKVNIHANQPIWFSMSTLLLFLCIAIVPWFFFPKTVYTLSLLGIELLLFVLYSVPPFRFKERGFLGIITDSLYAHTIPALLALTAFEQHGDFPFSTHRGLWGSLILWQFFLGIRNILFHQIADYENDIKSGVRTFVTTVSVIKTEQLLQKLFIPFEIITFLFFCFVLSFAYLSMALALLIIYILFLSYQRSAYLSSTHPVYRKFCYFFLDDFYIEWLPIIFLLCLLTIDIRYSILLLIHILFFKNCIKRLLKLNF